MHFSLSGNPVTLVFDTKFPNMGQKEHSLRGRTGTAVHNNSENAEFQARSLSESGVALLSLV